MSRISKRKRKTATAPKKKQPPVYEPTVKIQVGNCRMKSLGRDIDTAIETTIAKLDPRCFPDGSEESLAVALTGKRCTSMKEIEDELYSLGVVLELIVEILSSYASEEGLGLISGQQLHCPSTERNKKVRMLLQRIRKLG